MPTVCTLLNTGGDYKPKHAQVLQREVLKWSPPGTDFVCYSNTDVPGVKTIPLKMGWPGWWGQFEMFDSSVRGDFLYMDLDTVIVGPLDDFLVDGPVATYLGCGALKWLPEESRVEPGELFRANPERIMEEYWGEDVFLRAVWAKQFALPRTFKDDQPDKRKWTRDWSTELPGQIVYRKRGSAFCRRGRIAYGPDARLIMFAGTPRPWHTPEFRGLYK